MVALSLYSTVSTVMGAFAAQCLMGVRAAWEGVTDSRALPEHERRLEVHWSGARLTLWPSSSGSPFGSRVCKGGTSERLTLGFPTLVLAIFARREYTPVTSESLEWRRRRRTPREKPSSRSTIRCDDVIICLWRDCVMW